jgi:hypothetical protein
MKTRSEGRNQKRALNMADRSSAGSCTHVDNETSAHSGESHTDELDGETGDDLVSEVCERAKKAVGTRSAKAKANEGQRCEEGGTSGPSLIVEDGELLDDEDIHGVGSCNKGDWDEE